MAIYVTVTNDDERESAVIGISKKWTYEDGTTWTETEIELTGGKSQRLVVQEDDALQLVIREVHEPKLCWC